MASSASMGLTRLGAVVSLFADFLHCLMDLFGDVSLQGATH